ncbi:MAG: hypothetical protein ABWK53_05815 [Anaerolineales bacterium]
MSNLRTLTSSQQELLWEKAYATPELLTRALALLVLGRQRPLSERTKRKSLTCASRPKACPASLHRLK